MSKGDIVMTQIIDYGMLAASFTMILFGLIGTAVKYDSPFAFLVPGGQNALENQECFDTLKKYGSIVFVLAGCLAGMSITVFKDFIIEPELAAMFILVIAGYAPHMILSRFHKEKLAAKRTKNAF